jgi:hypothetical protein
MDSMFSFKFKLTKAMADIAMTDRVAAKTIGLWCEKKRYRSAIIEDMIN